MLSHACAARSRNSSRAVGRESRDAARHRRRGVDDPLVPFHWRALQSAPVTPTAYRRDMNSTAALLAAVEIGDPLTRGSLALFPLFHELPATGRYLSGP